MICQIYDEPGMTWLRNEEKDPICGEDFCDRCGDCLACDGDGLCYPDEQAHIWIQYGEKK